MRAVSETLLFVLTCTDQENDQYHADSTSQSNGTDDELDVRSGSPLSRDPLHIPTRPSSSSIREHFITSETELNGNKINHRQEVESDIYDNVEEEPVFAQGAKPHGKQNVAIKKDWRTNGNKSHSNDDRILMGNGLALTPGSEMSGSEEDNLANSADFDHSMSLLSNSSGGLSPDVPLATLAPPPTPSTPTGESGANLAQKLLLQERNSKQSVPQKFPRSDGEVVPSALSLIANSVSATAEMLQNSTKQKPFPTSELSEVENLDISLPTIERTVSNAVNPLEFDPSVTSGFDDDVFLDGGESRDSDYAELRLDSFCEQGLHDDSYQSLKKVQMKKMETGILMEGSQEVCQLLDMTSTEGYPSLQNVHEHFENLCREGADQLPDVCAYEGGGDDKISPLLDPAFDVDYDEPPDDSLFMEDALEIGRAEGSTTSSKPPPPPERKTPTWVSLVLSFMVLTHQN